MDIRQELAILAEFDLDLPGSVISDAWDICHMAGETAPTLAIWTKALETAIKGYYDNLDKGVRYTHNPMKLVTKD